METKVLKKWCGLGILISGLFIFGGWLKIDEIANLHFGSYHAWRQADCISVTNNLYDGQGNMWSPRTHFAKDDATGIAAGELPLLNELVAKIYWLIGKHDSVYRWTVFLFYIVGILFLYLLFFEISGHAILSALMALLISQGSVLVYYAINYLPDVPALSLSIIGLYTITVAKRKRKLSSYLLGLFFVLLACLMKLTLLVLLGSIAAVLVVEICVHGRIIFNTKALLAIGLFILSIWGWYYHAYQIDHNHLPFIFLTETRSYWQTFILERPMVWQDVWHRWLPQVYLPAVWVLMLLGGTVSTFFSKKVKIEWVLLTAMSVLFASLFFIFMFKQFRLHDYLWIGLLIVPILFCILFLQGVTGTNNPFFKNAIILIIGMLLILQGFQSKMILRERYFQFDNELVYNKHLFGITTELRNHGIQKTDLVISIPDASPNISLVAMDQFGFTNYRDKNKDSVGIASSITMGAQFLIVSKPAELKMDYIQPFLKYFIFDYKGIGVFDLRKYR